LQFTLAILKSQAYPPEQLPTPLGMPTGSAVSPADPRNRVLALLTLGKPAILNTVTKSQQHQRMQIEVTATRLD